MKEKSQQAGQIFMISNAPTDQQEKGFPNKLMLYNSKTGKVVKVCASFFEQHFRSEPV